MYVVALLWLAITFTEIDAEPKKEINGTIVVVTGGAKGIGFAIADNYLKNGARIAIIVDINRPRGIQAECKLNRRYGAKRAAFIHGDITKDVDRVPKIIFQTWGSIDILVNNAAIFNEKCPVKTILTNALGTALWSQRFFEMMRKDKGGKGGTIIILSSIVGYYIDPFSWFYKMTKYAVLGLTFSLGHEYNFLFSGVNIFAICPGPTDTDMVKQLQKLVENEQVDVYQKLLKTYSFQPADVVGKAAVDLYGTAKTGTAYTVENCQPPVVSPDKFVITAEQLLSLE